MKNYPKILFIADEIPQSINAGSIQFFRLFKDYPIDKLMVIGRKPSSNAEVLNCKYFTLEYPFLDKIRTSRFSSHLTDMQSLGLFLPTLSKHLEKKANEFQPDIVVSLMQLITFYYPAYKYAKQKKLPFILFCHDDVEDFARPHSFFNKYLIKINTKIYQSAKKRICISPEMAIDWEKKYKAKGDYLYPIASESIKNRPIEKAKELVTPSHITIGYAGSLAYGYREGVNEILPILEKTNTKLRIYRNNDNNIIISSAIEFVGYATTPEETWNRIVEECDAVILPYSNDKRFEKLYSTHFPSKLPEYIKLQMPIIINGPKYANGIKYSVVRSRIISTTNNTQLEKAILILKDQERRIYYSKPINDNNFNIKDSFYKHLVDI